jgi:FkbM family methyltransferase
MTPTEQRFFQLITRGQKHERRRATERAMCSYREAAAMFPGHALPVTCIATLAARERWGYPPRPPPANSSNRPAVAMSCLGQHGRFGNQILQYAYLRLYAEACGADAETGDWIGRDLLALDDPVIARALPQLSEQSFPAAAAIAGGGQARANVDLVGFFAFNTAGYSHRRQWLQQLFRLRGPARAALEPVWRQISQAGRTIVAIHLRRRDFGYGRFWIAPTAWYLQWLEVMWPQWQQPWLYIATDDDSVLADFAAYHPACVADFPVLPKDLEFVLDFFVLTQADVVATSNSTFSFAAAMLNDRARLFLRPDVAARGLIEFNPWNATPLNDPPWIATGSSVTPGERGVIAQFIRPESTVFDVGAGRGEWSRIVHEQPSGHVHIFVFEPNPSTFSTLATWAETTRPGSATVVNSAVADEDGLRPFYFYDGQDEPSGLFVRRDPIFDHRPPPRQIEVPCTSIDSFCNSRGIRHIGFLKVAAEGAELDVLRGCSRMLSHARIDVIQFEYGATYKDGNRRLRDVYELLAGSGYVLFRIGASREHLPHWIDALEDYAFANFLAVNGRLAPYIGIGARQMPDLPSLILRHGVRVRGAIHIGAHAGEEIDTYRKAGVPRIIMIEANPAVFAELRKRTADSPDIVCVLRAVADVNATRRFRVTNMSQSSSLLPLGRHSQIYPQIVEQSEIEVQCSRLDDLMVEIGEDEKGYNLLNIDVQGAELMVLEGAKETLKNIDLVNIEVNFDELYVGCPQIDDIDDFLAERDFVRVQISCPFHPMWGDAVYLRRR